MNKLRELIQEAVEKGLLRFFKGKPSSTALAQDTRQSEGQPASQRTEVLSAKHLSAAENHHQGGDEEVVPPPAAISREPPSNTQRPATVRSDEPDPIGAGSDANPMQDDPMLSLKTQSTVLSTQMNDLVRSVKGMRGQLTLLETDIEKMLSWAYEIQANAEVVSSRYVSRQVWLETSRKHYAEAEAREALHQKSANRIIGLLDQISKLYNLPPPGALPGGANRHENINTPASTYIAWLGSTLDTLKVSLLDTLKETCDLRPIPIQVDGLLPGKEGEDNGVDVIEHVHTEDQNRIGCIADIERMGYTYSDGRPFFRRARVKLYQAIPKSSSDS